MNNTGLLKIIAWIKILEVVYVEEERRAGLDHTLAVESYYLQFSPLLFLKGPQETLTLSLTVWSLGATTEDFWMSIVGN